MESALFFCQLNAIPSFNCNEYNFYDDNQSHINFGWVNSKFVSNTSHYLHTKEIDGVCPFEWRQGVKHDCSKIMELDKANGFYVNGLNEEIKLEDGLIYGFLKSSDLKTL
ncbi:unnamed protein product [marine sediment metagenome]|uniref:Uncharacterized protein n=1 Tax=marine sediment metagenome TaxID=412755 RepID=X1BFV4_9ZZZZ